MNKCYRLPALVTLTLALVACGDGTSNAATGDPADQPKKTYTEPPPLDPNNIVSVALGSKDHTTLVAALKAADYVRSVANTGPMTVFAPTNAAFDALAPGTVEGLLEPGKVDDLKEVLKYHVAVSSYRPADLARLDGKKLGMANMKNVEIKVVDGKPTINGANIVATIDCSNGILHVVDQVLLPPQ